LQSQNNIWSLKCISQKTKTGKFRLDFDKNANLHLLLRIFIHTIQKIQKDGWAKYIPDYAKMSNFAMGKMLGKGFDQAQGHK
jgi:hypothetical protein